MAYVKLLVPFADREAGDVVDVPATVARGLIYERKAIGGSLPTGKAKPIDLNARPKQDPAFTPPAIKPALTKTELVYPKMYKPLDGTVKQLREWLDKRGVKYNQRLRKEELIELVKKS